MKKIAISIIVSVGVLLVCIQLFSVKEIPIARVQEKKIIKKEVNRLVASVNIDDPVWNKINKLSELDKKKVIIESDNDKMGLDEFQKKIAELSIETGWNLYIEKSPDGHTHILNHVEVKDYGDKPLPAFTEEEWIRSEETFLNLINEDDNIHLTDNDRDTLEKWNN